MFREMRRKKQELSRSACEAVLNRATAGVLAVSGDDGYPYAVPLSYVYQGGKLYFHSATTGHKLDAIRSCDKVSFCVIDQDEIVPAEYTTYFRSVIVFGRARILEEEGEKRAALASLAARYSPNHKQGREEEIEKGISRVCMVEITPEHISGKEAVELTRAKNVPLHQ